MNDFFTNTHVYLNKCVLYFQKIHILLLDFHRGVYCALVSALLTNTRTPGMFEYTGEWLAR